MPVYREAEPLARGDPPYACNGVSYLKADLPSSSPLAQGRDPAGSSNHERQRVRAHTQRRCPLTPRTAHHTPLVAVLQSAARARCTGPTCGRRYVWRGSTRGSAPTTSNAPPWHRGADDQAQRTTPGKRSRASTFAAGRRAAPSHGQPRAAVDRQAHASTRTHCSEGKGEGLAPSPRGELPRPTTRPRTHHPAASRSAGLQPVFRVPPVVRFGRLGRRGGEQGTRL